MITYQGKKYKNLIDMANKLGVRFSVASHLYTVNGGKSDDPANDFKKTQSVFVEQMIKEDKEKLDAKLFKKKKGPESLDS